MEQGFHYAEITRLEIERLQLVLGGGFGIALRDCAALPDVGPDIGRAL